MSPEGRNNVVQEFWRGQYSLQMICAQLTQRIVVVFQQELHTVAPFREWAKPSCNFNNELFIGLDIFPRKKVTYSTMFLKEKGEDIRGKDSDINDV